MKTTKKNSSLKGIIVMDTTEFESLSNPYDTSNVVLGSTLDELRKDGRSTGSYLDLLILLADRGWKIVVPEKVAHESAGVIYLGTTATDLNRFFDLTPPQYHTQPTVSEFLLRVMNDPNKFPKITVPEAEGGKEYSAALRHIKRSYDNFLLHPFNDFRSMMRKMLRAVRKHAGDPDSVLPKKDMGEKHCIDVILHEKTRHPDTPIFFVTGDIGGRKALYERCGKKSCNNHIGELTTGGILAALGEERSEIGVSALELFGLKGEINMHWRRIAKTGCDLPHYRRRGGEEDMPLGKLESKEHPFLNAICGLAKELSAEKYAKEEAAKMEPRNVPGRAAKFNQKFAGTYGNGKRREEPNTNGNTRF